MGFGGHLGCEHVRTLGSKPPPQLVRDVLVRADVVDHPHGAVAVETLRLRRDEVQRDERRVGPVEHARRQPVMLAEREPVPQRVDRDGLARRVLPKAADEMAFQARGVTAELYQARRQRVGRIPPSAKREV
jgi:hypothetical protein